MKRLTRQILNAAIITTVFAIAGVIIRMKVPGLVDGISISLLLPSFLIITSLSLFVFNSGVSKPPDTQPLFTLSAVGIKFFLAAILALVYFVALKKTDIRFVILFFVLYLAFTFYLIMVIHKALKDRSLKKEKV